MASRIGEKIKYAFNPMPAITDEQVLKHAGLERVRRPSRLSPAIFQWKVDSGHNVAFFEIGAGDHLELRGSEVNIFLDAHQEWGGVVVDSIHDPEEVHKASLEGLQRAHESWSRNGLDRVADYQMNHGLNDEQVERRKGLLWRYYYNQAVADLIEEHIQHLETEGPALPDSSDEE